MKKIFFLFLALIILSGCGQNKIGEAPLENIPVNNTNNNEINMTNNLNEVDPGLATTTFPQENPGKVKGEKIQANSVVQETTATLKTNFGDIVIKFYAEESPLTVNNFLDLAKKGFYNNTKFHRVIKDFMIQGGDPNSKDDDWSNDGMGGPGYKFKDEFNNHKLVRGSLAMANSGPDTNGSQFFIVTAESTPWLDGKHTNFGYVESGMDVIDKIEAEAVNGDDHPLKDITIESIAFLNIQK